jgi:ATP-dependent RNA helicase DHX37/DHR1
MDSFAMPEVLTRPLEDVVLAMKAMRISNTANFPFPTPPDRGQLGAATRLLADLACLDTSNATDETSDGEITKLGAAVAQLPLGVRYGKMVLVAAEAGVLDYAIATVSALSQNSPFTTTTTEVEENDEENDADEQPEEEVAKSKRKGFWAHRGGDVLATVLAIGAFTHAGRNAGGAAQRLAFSRFCEQQGLNPIIMTRIHDMRIRLTRVMQNRLGGATVNKDAFHSLPPPTKLQERLLTQAIASGLLDHVATLAPAGTLTNNDHPLNLRSAYLGATTDSQEPLFLDRQSVLYTGDSRLLPQWICYDSLVRKTSKSGQTIVTMKGATALDPTWLGTLAKGSRLLQLSTPLASPVPIYRTDDDAILCSVTTKFGRHGWEIAPVRIPWPIAFGSNSAHRRTHRTLTAEDEYAWFARFLLEGRILFEFDALRPMLRQEAAALTNRKVRPKSIQTLLLALETADVSSKASLVQMWGTRGPRCLWAAVQPLLRPERVQEAEQLWLATARAHLATSSNHR